MKEQESGGEIHRIIQVKERRRLMQQSLDIRALANHSWVASGLFACRWTEKAKDARDNPIYSSMILAAQEMDKTNEGLSRLLAELQEG